MPRIRHRSPRAAGHLASGLRLWVAVCLCWLAGVQLVMPTLGAMHQVVHHVGAPAPEAGHAAHAPAAPQAQPAAHAHGGALTLSHLFDGHSAADCQVFDQMALGVGLTASPWAWAAPVPLHTPNWTAQALLLRKSPALFFARGPPALDARQG